MARIFQLLKQPPQRTWRRTDFAAPRVFVLRIEPATIARLYYDADTAPQAAMVDYLRAMRDELVQPAILNGSTVLADRLTASIRKHGSMKRTNTPHTGRSPPRKDQ
ncbi:hypothetical protein SAMN02787142_8022 [Burkholderia sp. WP9]|uniref:hypothetical protein n=1 Tax=Burkholderia sp. WP9 TaxID=1500263 RepID=UPI00089B15E9|nr:hypothetical protein [Burkholderia sp. WP9]SEF13254.1 hypothetical protein SAMN02787142_8022 [Burkholderia sp. WP9]